jgi:hypothetical protein
MADSMDTTAYWMVDRSVDMLEYGWDDSLADGMVHGLVWQRAYRSVALRVETKVG